MQVIDLKHIVSNVILTSKKAGDFIRSHKGKEYKIEQKGKNDFVTEIDKSCETMIVKDLQNILPIAGFITEENTVIAPLGDYNWIIDPIDGTTNFIHNFYPISVSIGLEYKGEILLGVVYEVGLDECFYAWQGGGAWLNGTRINVSNKENFSNSLLATGFPYHNFSALTNYIKLLDHITRNTQGIRRLGSAAVDMCYVAAGRFDGFYENDLKPYDVAGGIIIVKEAGGCICDFKEKNDYLFGGEIIVSNKNIFETFKKTVNSFMYPQE